MKQQTLRNKQLNPLRKRFRQCFDILYLLFSMLSYRLIVYYRVSLLVLLILSFFEPELLLLLPIIFAIVSFSLLTNVRYSMLMVSKFKKHEICARFQHIRYTLPEEQNQYIIDNYKKDLALITRDFHQPGIHLTARTHILFVYYILMTFAGLNAAMQFKQDFHHATRRTEREYWSTDNKTRVHVKYYKDKLNDSKAIKTWFCFSSMKNFKVSWQQFVKAARREPYYKVQICFFE